MFEVCPIHSFDDPSLGPYRTMRDQGEHHRGGIFVAEGEKVVRRLLESNLEVISVVMPTKWLAVYEPLLRERRESKLPVFVAEKEILEQLTGFTFYQGLMAVGRVPKPSLLVDTLKQSSGSRLLIAIDGLSSAENVGGLVRTACAFGVDAMIVGETSSSPYLRRAVRSSMGAVFKFKIIETQDLANTLMQVRQHGVRCLAAHPHAAGQRLSAIDLTPDICLVLGAEGEGLRPQVLGACDEAVAIPMASDVDSLNVGCAGAAFLYEIARQRQRA